MNTHDDDGLSRFVNAQEGVHETALRELQQGRKQTHWMWFVFPQLRGLGHSRMAHVYGIAGMQEAKAYLAHPVLGPRLAACTQAALAGPEHDAHRLFGSPDDLKFRSSMTLFDAAWDRAGHSPYAKALEVFFAGERDARTLALLRDG